MIEKILNIISKILGFVSDFMNFRKKSQIIKNNENVKAEVENEDVDKINERWKDSW